MPLPVDDFMRENLRTDHATAITRKRYYSFAHARERAYKDALDETRQAMREEPDADE